MGEGIQYSSGVAVDQLVDDPSAVAAQVQLVAERFPDGCENSFLTQLELWDTSTVTTERSPSTPRRTQHRAENGNCVYS